MTSPKVLPFITNQNTLNNNMKNLKTYYQNYLKQNSCMLLATKHYNLQQCSMMVDT